MQTIISASIAGIISGLLLEVQVFANNLPVIRDTMEHRAISRLGWFILFLALIYLVLRRYIGTGYSTSRTSGIVRQVIIGASSLFAFFVFAIHAIGIDVLVSLPKQLIDFANMWYAIPVAILIHFGVLFVVNKY